MLCSSMRINYVSMNTTLAEKKDETSENRVILTNYVYCPSVCSNQEVKGRRIHRKGIIIRTQPHKSHRPFTTD